MLHNLHSITEKKPIQTRSVRTPTDRKKIQLNDIASGLYHYEIHFLDGEKQFGKLSILK